MIINHNAMKNRKSNMPTNETYKSQNFTIKINVVFISKCLKSKKNIFQVCTT